MTEEERWQLKQFVLLCEKIKKCRYYAHLRAHKFTFTALGSVKPQTHDAIHYDEDEFRSFLTLFRKLIANRQPTCIFKVLKIVGRCNEYDRPDCREIKKYLKEAERHGSMGIESISVNEQSENERKEYTPKDIVDTLFNADIFHTDKKRQSDLEAIKRFKPQAQVALVLYALKVVLNATKLANKLEFRLGADAVVVADNGRKYHKNECLRSTRRTYLHKRDAINKGYRACKRCKP